MIINSNVSPYGQYFEEDAGDLRAYTATEIGDGIVETIVALALHARDEQLYPYEQEKHRYGIKNEIHAIDKITLKSGSHKAVLS